jgi:Prokaryotic N-terminal methylation motif
MEVAVQPPCPDFCPDVSPDDRGSSLIEMVVAMALFSMLLVTSLTMVFSTTSSSQNTGWRASTEPILRDALDAALGELRSAAPKPICAMPPGTTSMTGCRRIDQNVNGASVTSATAASLCFTTNRPAPGGAATAVRQPLWKTCLTTTSGILSAEHYAPTGTPVATLLDSSYGGSPSDTARLADTPATFAFEYRDVYGAVMPIASLPSRLAEITSVAITATATRTSPTGTQTDSATVTASLRPHQYGGS